MEMYAVIEVGGKQYAVRKDDILDVEKQEGEKGATLVLDKVLLLSGDGDIQVGRPYVKGASVKALLINRVKGEKLISFKYRRRKASHWKKGHRQQLTRIKIDSITVSGK